MSLGEYRHPEGQVVFYLNIYKSSASTFCVCSSSLNEHSLIPPDEAVSVHAVDRRSSQPIRGIFTSRFASFARQNLRARGKGRVVNYPRGAGSNADCAPHSAGNRGMPEGQDRAWGRSGCEHRNKAEKDISKTGALCRHHSVVLSNGMMENFKNTDHIFAFKTSVV